MMELSTRATIWSTMLSARRPATLRKKARTNKDDFFSIVSLFLGIGSAAILEHFQASCSAVSAPITHLKERFRTTSLQGFSNYGDFGNSSRVSSSSYLLGYP